MFTINTIKNAAARRGKGQFLACFLVLGVSQHLLRKNFVQCKDINYNHFVFGSHVIPHPEKVAKGGEDAFHADDKILAAADGVGGWADAGVDPANYSKELCRHITGILSSNRDKYVKNPKALVIEAAGKTKSVGSSTLCVVTLDSEQPILRSAFIGDSGYVIYRMGNKTLDLVHQSEEHQRDFNFPYQIGTHGDPPNMSLEFTHKILDNDIVVVGTDGLFDNLDQKQIADCVKPYVQESNGELTDVTKTAEAIAKVAYKFSLDNKYDSPFAKRARQYRLRYQGGKSDDITVLVGQVKLAQKSGSSASTSATNSSQEL